MCLLYVTMCVCELNDIENDDSQVFALNTGITIFIIVALVTVVVAAVADIVFGRNNMS